MARKKAVKKTKNRDIKKIAVVLVVFGLVGVALTYLVGAVTSIKASGNEVTAGEGSGMVASRQYPGVFWWHRDGGDATADKPRDAVYAMKLDANGVPQAVRGSDKYPSFAVDYKNNNWEDIAIDEQNNIWIGDIGANKCDRNNQTLVKVKEPNPASNEAATVLAKYTFKFPDPASGCNTWNSESMFWLDGKMYIFAKTNGSPVYRVDLPSGTSGTAKLVRLGAIGGNVSNISVSSISDDRTRLMVAAHGTMNVFKTTNTTLQGDALVKDLISRAPAFTSNFETGNTKKPNVEGGTYVRGSHNVIFVSEGKQLFFAKASQYGDSDAPASTVDTTVPTVSIKSPANGATVSGKVVIEVDASDNVGVKQVNVFYNKTGVIREGTAQGNYGWGTQFNTENLGDGKHTFDVVAYDAAGNSSTAQVTVTVKNASTPTGDTTAPTVSIKSPANGATVSGKIVIEVEASDNVALKQVRILADGTKELREGLTQGNYGWGTQYNTTGLSNGSHVISVVGTDTAGNVRTAQITVNVKN